MRIAAIVTIAAAALLLASGATAKTGASVLAVSWSGPNAWVRLLDAETLAPRGRPLPLSRTSAGPHALSPDGRRLALHTAKHGVRILALPSMRVLRTVRPGILTTALRWQSRRRLLVIEHGGALLLDPTDGRIVARRTWEDEHVDWRPWQGGVVLLASRGHGIGPAKLLVVDGRLQTRTVDLERILAGTDGGENNQGPFRSFRPGLALDPLGRRAFVAGGSVVATIDLRTLAVRYHAPARTPQKVSDGPVREAAWLGGGVLAVSGADYEAAGETQRMTPYGLRLLDVESGRATLVDEQATSVRAAGGLALATSVMWTERPPTGRGLRAYDPAGRLVWHRYGGARMAGVLVVGARLYAPVGRSAWEVLDAATGRTTASRSGLRMNLLG
jgi:hypothetical protein